jgi:hypothetical protein
MARGENVENKDSTENMALMLSLMTMQTHVSRLNCSFTVKPSAV